MRTTKHGMNMGVLILLFILGVFAVNFLAVKNNKKWDLTAEGLNSLSDQSVKILKSLDAPLSIKFFYRGGTEGVASVQGQFKELTEMYKDESSQFSVEFIDSIKRPGLAKEYGVSRATAQVFVDYKGKRKTPINSLAMPRSLKYSFSGTIVRPARSTAWASFDRSRFETSNLRLRRGA